MGGAWRIAAVVTLPSQLDAEGLPTLSPTFAAVPIVEVILGAVTTVVGSAHSLHQSHLSPRDPKARVSDRVHSFFSRRSGAGMIRL